MAIDTIKATAILDGAVDTADLADGAVTTAKITDGEVTDAKIASGITSSKLTGALPAIDGSSLTGVDPADGSITTAKLDSTLDLSGKTVTYGLTDSDMPSGSVLQVVQGYKTNIFTTTSTTYVAVPDLSLNITPISTSSKILICINLNAGIAGNAGGVQVFRDSSAIGLPDSVSGKTHRYWLNVYNGGDDSNSTPNWGMFYLDSPSTTSQVTYSVRVACVQGGGTLVINDLTSQQTSTSYSGTFVSHITAMEISG